MPRKITERNTTIDLVSIFERLEHPHSVEDGEMWWETWEQNTDEDCDEDPYFLPEMG